MSTDPVVTPWVVFPLAMVALLVVAGHLLMLRELAIGMMPESRRQIRMTTGWVMMVAVPMLAYGFGVVSPSDAQNFGLVWTANIGLLGAIVLLACVDAINSMRLARARIRELQDEFAEYLSMDPELIQGSVPQPLRLAHDDQSPLKGDDPENAG